MLRFSSLKAAAALGLTTVTLGAIALPAAQPAQPLTPAAGSVGALTLEHMPSLLSAGWMARAEAGERRRAALIDQLAAHDHAYQAEVLASPRIYPPASTDVLVDTRAAEAAAIPSAALSLVASSPLPADFAGSAYDLRPVAAEPATTTSPYREAGVSFSAHAAAPNDYAAAAPVRSSVWTESAAPVVSASSYVSAPSAFAAPVAISQSSYAVWQRPALPGSATPAAPSYPTSASSARPIATTAVGLSSRVVTAATPIPISLASSDGNASTQTASFGITPSAGTQQFLLTTINPAGSLPTGYGTTPSDTNITNLNTYFGLAAGTLAGRGAADGSGYLSQQVTLGQGNMVSFDYVFLTDEDNTLTGSQFHNDQAFFTVNGVINTTLYQASQFSTAQLGNGSNTIFSFQTPGYVTVSYTVPASGNYTFGFGVIDLGANTIKSGLLIDNFDYTTVPEPATWAGGALLLGAAGARLRRRRQV